ncbi:IclR family transcriptional regulator [Cupriavidus sp. CuC1]|uniref:IclR family transcriptional regulator n=1 Tax=Cupriavidus sp. CuC1 TaxID=3373131 RepID=UPI0037D8483F
MSGVTVTAVERVIDILEAFQASQRPLSLAEAIDIAKSTCHAIVSTLMARGYLYSLTRPRALYPTRHIYDVARDIIEKDPFVERATPVLERLRDATRETVILGKRQGESVIYLQVIEGVHAIRYTAKPGEFKPLHSSSIGKAILGGLKEQELRGWLADRDLPAITRGHAKIKAYALQSIIANLGMTPHHGHQDRPGSPCARHPGKPARRLLCHARRERQRRLGRRDLPHAEQ